jgi:hypothetical protein
MEEILHGSHKRWEEMLWLVSDTEQTKNSLYDLTPSVSSLNVRTCHSQLSLLDALLPTHCNFTRSYTIENAFVTAFIRIDRFCYFYSLLHLSI